ncbi:MAG: hypothetical protein ACFB3T_12340 [Geminicoccaceae bacterium]
MGQSTPSTQNKAVNGDKASERRLVMDSAGGWMTIELPAVAGCSGGAILPSNERHWQSPAPSGKSA